MLTLTASQGRLSLTLTAQRLGLDVSICLFGGERPHIGAVAVAQPRPSLRDASENSASCSVITLVGHKDDEPARDMALYLATQLNVAVSVACGIHVDNITPEELHAATKLCHELGERCGEALKTILGHPD